MVTNKNMSYNKGLYTQHFGEYDDFSGDKSSKFEQKKSFKDGSVL